MNAPLIRLSEGDAIIIDGVWYRESARSAGSLTLAPIGGTVSRTFTGTELMDLYFDPAGRMRIVRGEIALLAPSLVEAVSRPFESFSPDQQTQMLMRMDYVKACDRFFARKLYNKRPEDGYAKISRITARYRRMVMAAHQGKRTSAIGLESVGGSTLRDWYGRWRKSGRLLGALAPLTHKRGNHEPRLDPAVRHVIAACIREKWLTLEAPPLTVVYDLVCRRIAQLNEGRELPPLKEPNEIALRRWIADNVDGYTETFFRKGRKEAEHQFRLTQNSPRIVRPLQVVEFDETPLDVLLIDENGRLRGRAYLTAGICVATGMIVGWHIGWDKPGYATIMQALRMAVSRKDLTGSGAESDYPVYGVPEMIKVDNGPAYRSTSLVAAAGQLQFELRLVPVGKPNLKGKVERFFREVATDFTSVIPGRTFSNVQQRGDYPSEGYASMTLEQVQRMFTRWVVDIYHNRPNSRAFSQTPLDRWNALSGCGVRLPPEAVDLTPLLGLIVHRTIQADGITFMGLTYRDPILIGMKKDAAHMGHEWLVKVDPNDISHLLVLDERNRRWVPVRCQQPHLVEGLTLKMWMQVVSSARERTKAGQRVARATLLRARENLMIEAEAAGHRPRGKITTAEYRWIDAELLDNQEEYEIKVDPDGDDQHSSRAKTPKSRKAKPKPDRSPAMSAAASKAGGYPVAEQIDPHAHIADAQADLHREVAEEEATASSRKLMNEGRHDHAELPVPTLAPPDDEEQDNETPGAAAPPVVPEAASDDDAIQLVDDDDDDHYG